MKLVWQGDYSQLIKFLFFYYFIFKANALKTFWIVWLAIVFKLLLFDTSFVHKCPMLELALLVTV